MIPTSIYDDDAERVVAGCAVASPLGARLAGDRLRPGQFHDARFRALFEIAGACPLADQDDRITDCAIATGQHPLAVEEIVRTRPTMEDARGVYARRVADAATRRREAAALLAQLEDMGVTIESTVLAR